jgi:hypothetical protein
MRFTAAFLITLTAAVFWVARGLADNPACEAIVNQTPELAPEQAPEMGFWNNISNRPALERSAGRRIWNASDLATAVRMNRSRGVESAFVIVRKPNGALELRLAQESYQGHVAIAGGRPVLAAGRIAFENGRFVFDNFTGNYQTSAKQERAISYWFKLVGEGATWRHESEFPGRAESGHESLR